MANPIPYKLKNGQTRYKITVYGGLDHNGKQINFNKQGFRTKAEANRWEAFKRTEIAHQGLGIEDDHLTFRKAYDRWVVGYESTVAGSTFRKTSRMFENHILPFFGDKKIGKITKLDHQKFINEISKSMPVTYKKAYMYFTKMIKDLDQPIPQNLTFPRPQESEKKNVVYDREQLNTFLEACRDHRNPNVYPFFRLLAYTGMRKSEIIALEWKAVDLARSYLQVTQAMTRDKDNKTAIGPPKNKASQRTITLDQETVNILKAHPQVGKYVFHRDLEGNQHLNPNAPRKWMISVCNKIDLPPITIHGFRHTHCSLLFQAGLTVREVQDRLGHESPEMTLQVYTHITRQQAIDVPDRFADFMES